MKGRNPENKSDTIRKENKKEIKIIIKV